MAKLTFKGFLNHLCLNMCNAHNLLMQNSANAEAVLLLSKYQETVLGLVKIPRKLSLYWSNQALPCLHQMYSANIFIQQTLLPFSFMDLVWFLQSSWPENETTLLCKGRQGMGGYQVLFLYDPQSHHVAFSKSSCSGLDIGGLVLYLYRHVWIFVWYCLRGHLSLMPLNSCCSYLELVLNSKLTRKFHMIYCCQCVVLVANQRPTNHCWGSSMTYFASEIRYDLSHGIMGCKYNLMYSRSD